MSETIWLAQEVVPADEVMEKEEQEASGQDETVQETVVSEPLGAQEEAEATEADEKAEAVQGGATTTGAELSAPVQDVPPVPQSLPQGNAPQETSGGQEAGTLKVPTSPMEEKTSSGVSVYLMVGAAIILALMALLSYRRKKTWDDLQDSMQLDDKDQPLSSPGPFNTQDIKSIPHSKHVSRLQDDDEP